MYMANHPIAANAALMGVIDMLRAERNILKSYWQKDFIRLFRDKA